LNPTIATFPPTHAEALRRLDAIDPAEYARSRNALDGAVTGLSPYFTHGVVGMREAVSRVLQRRRIGFDDKLSFEFAWREFFHHVWTREGERVLRDMRAADVWGGKYARELPADIRQGRTGVPCIDAAVRQLYATGYLHNHARMWLASYVVHLRKVHWRAGADWLYGHLLDGDVPSNHLSWQWVAATFSSKPYLFNAENVARYAPKAGFKAWLSNGTVVDQSYEELEAVARGAADCGPERGTHEGVEEPALLNAPPPDLDLKALPDDMPLRRDFELVHPWALCERTRETSGPSPWRIGVVHLPAHAALPWSEARWRWVMGRMAAVTDAVFVGNLAAGTLRTRLPAAHAVLARRAPLPGYDAPLAAMATLRDAPRLLPNPERSCRSFSAFYGQVKTQSRSLQALLNGELF